MKTVTIKLGDRAMLKGTSVVCTTGRAKNGAISLECGKGDGAKAFANGADSAWVNDDAVNVYLNNAGKFTLVKTYKNRK